MLSSDNCLADWATLLLLPLFHPPLLQAGTVKHMQAIGHDTHRQTCLEFFLADYTRILTEFHLRLHKLLFWEQFKKFFDVLLQIFSERLLRESFLLNLCVVPFVSLAATAAFRAHNEAAEKSEHQGRKKA